MTSDSPASDKPPRRPRYRGTHPRQFTEKYKEHQPEKYADDVAKIIDSGKTPAGSHRPIMVREILDILAPRPGHFAVDCTLGYGGHARELLAAIQPGGQLLGVDADPIELPKTEARLRELGFPDEALHVQRTNYAGIAPVLFGLSPEGADCLLADLGLSSMQIDTPDRGFTYKFDGPLDMRMNPQRHPSAAELLARIDEDALARLLAENADEPQADEFAATIVSARQRTPLTTTRQLADVLRRAQDSHSPQADPDVSLRRVFQAIRIAVNDELATLDSFLRQLPTFLKPGGRVAILTFHSGEDRRVKTAFKSGLAAGLYSTVAPDVLRPSAEEQRANPRSTSAKLRYAIRADG